MTSSPQSRCNQRTISVVACCNALIERTRVPGGEDVGVVLTAWPLPTLALITSLTVNSTSNEVSIPVPAISAVTLRGVTIADVEEPA
ncbi:MAG: hypothetical protein R2843_15725 [Thermomicrobiales bacterium]